MQWYTHITTDMQWYIKIESNADAIWGLFSKNACMCDRDKSNHCEWRSFQRNNSLARIVLHSSLTCAI